MITLCTFRYDRRRMASMHACNLIPLLCLLLKSHNAIAFVSGLGRSHPSSISVTRLSSTTPSSLEDINWEEMGQKFVAEVKEVSACLSLAIAPVLRSDASVKVDEIVRLCDDLDALETDTNLWTSKALGLRRRALEFQRYELLCKVLRSSYDDYVATASFLSPSRIPRRQLPNVQDVPYRADAAAAETPATPSVQLDENGVPLVPDCDLEQMNFKDSLLDRILLKVFRNLVEKNTGGISSQKAGIHGLLEQGRTFMLQPNQTPEAQHKMVYDTLAGLMTPFLPPFYRIFMSGIVPDIGDSDAKSEWSGRQLGPWFYAPWLTSVVTPPFFGFLVGPSYPNLRKDGQLGGLLVEKCKFLQESGCKGLCLHQCKLPAQQFFQEELGLALTVSPNFETQECQWSFGETPLPPAQDPSFPKGCLVGCESRKAVAGTKADLCNY